MNRVKPLLVLLGGPTCSGKTSIACAVRESLLHGTCSVIGLDSYYRDLSHLPFAQRAMENFDQPDAFDWPLLKEHVERLCMGQPVAAPRYDFADHARSSDTIAIPPTRVLVIEGILALHDRGLCGMSGLRIFIDAPDRVCLDRRIDRDKTERGRTEESVRAQFHASVLPMAERYVRSTRDRADLVLNGTEDIAVLTARVLERIQALLGHF